MEGEMTGEREKRKEALKRKRLFLFDIDGTSAIDQ